MSEFSLTRYTGVAIQKDHVEEGVKQVIDHLAMGFTIVGAPLFATKDEVFEDVDEVAMNTGPDDVQFVIEVTFKVTKYETKEHTNV